MNEKSDELSIDERYDQVVEYLRESIEKLVSTKMISPNKKRYVDANYVSSRLVEVLKNSLSSEREDHLEDLMRQLFKLNSDKENLERELAQVKGSTERETIRYTQENEQLQHQFAQIEDELKTIEWRQTTKEAAYKADLKQKQKQLQSLKNVINSSHQIQLGLSEGVSNLKKSIIKAHKNQVKLIRRAKELCTEKLKETLELESQRQNMNEAQEIKVLQNVLLKEKADYRKNQRLCQSLLNAVWAISKEPPLDITPETFTQKLPELKAYIQRALQYHKRVAIAELKEEVTKQIPDIEFDSDNIIESVQSYIAKKVQEKDLEYQRIIKRGEEREKRLKQKLQEALIKIEQQQDGTDDSDDNDEAIISDFEKTQEEWDLQRKQLDEKMKLLKLSSSTSLHKSFLD